LPIVSILYNSYSGFLFVGGAIFWVVGGARIEDDARVEGGPPNTFGVLLPMMPDFDKSSTFELFFAKRLSSPNLSNTSDDALF
jgi:hypothetical protein